MYVRLDQIDTTKLTCVFCKRQFALSPEPHPYQNFVEHIATNCEQHPMRVMRDALAFYAKESDLQPVDLNVGVLNPDPDLSIDTGNTTTHNYDVARQAFAALNLSYE